MSLSSRAFRLLLLVYPRRFRERYREELIDFFESEREARARRRAPLAGGVWWLRVLWDLVRVGVRLRIAGMGSPARSRPRTERARGMTMDGLWQDIICALRGMRRRPGFTSVVILTLALGIGANTAIFSVVRNIVLKPLPYLDPDGLVMVWEHNFPRDRWTNVVSPANFVAWRDLDPTPFSDMASIVQYSGTLTGLGEAERVGVVRASPTLFSMLGVRPVRGRMLTASDDLDASPSVALVSYEYWQRRFGQDPAAVGQTVSLNGRTVEIVGVLAPRFSFDLPYTFDATGTQDFWLPAQLGATAFSERGRYLQVVARLKPETTIELAQSRMTAVAVQLEDQFPEFQTGWGVNVVSLHEQQVGGVRTPLLILLGAVGFVLLIACANVANLLLSKAVGRHQEFALRSALGAGRGRVIRQLLTESGVLSVVGAAAGVLVALTMVKVLITFGPDSMPRLGDVRVDGLALVFTLGLSMVTTLIFGAVPALRLSGLDLKDALSDGGGRGGTARGHAGIRNAFVVAEVALSLMLLVGAGLLVRSFGQLLNVGVGFDTGGVLAAQVDLPSRSFPSQELRVRTFEGLVDRLQQAPGVTDASAITFLPLAGSGSATSFWVNDRPIPRDGELPVADVRWVHRDYHRVMRIPLIAGRYFDEGDNANAPLRVVVSEFVANEFWPGENPIGRTISMPWGDTLVAEVIGVVGDVRHNGPAVEPRSALYWDHRQFQSFNSMTLVVRSTADPVALVPTVREAVQSVDPDLPLFNVRTMDAYFDDAMAESRFAMLALAVFAVGALILATVGIYGVMSYAVNQQTREIGIKIALGAGGSAVERQVLGSGLLLAGSAVAIGVVGALALSRVMQGMVFDVSTTDPVTIGAVSILLIAVAGLASWLPARRASRIDPMEALRE